MFVFEESEAGVTRAVWLPVKTGIQDNLHIALKTDDLQEGTEVIKGPYDQVARKLEDGQLVTRSAGTKSWEEE
jgi:hypothetical protein